MKKLHALWAILALCVLSLGFTACSDDEDDSTPNPPTIESKWVAVYVEYCEKENGKIIDEGKENGEFYMLKINANGEGKAYEKDAQNNWILDQETKKVVLKSHHLEFYYSDGETQIIPITSRNEKSMVLELNETETDVDGTIYESYEKMIFEKR